MSHSNFVFKCIFICFIWLTLSPLGLSKAQAYGLCLEVFSSPNGTTQGKASKLPEQLKIATWNLYKFHFRENKIHNFEELPELLQQRAANMIDFIETTRPDILLLQETGKKDFERFLNPYLSADYRFYSFKKKEGPGFLVKKNLPVIIVPEIFEKHLTRHAGVLKFYKKIIMAISKKKPFLILMNIHLKSQQTLQLQSKLLRGLISRETLLQKEKHISLIKKEEFRSLTQFILELKTQHPNSQFIMGGDFK